jgi:hypothetical protein
MRTVDEIRNTLRTAFVSNAVLKEAYGLNPAKRFEEQFSVASVEAVLTDLAARTVYDHEYLTGVMLAGIEAQINAQIPFSAQWYQAKALEFQKGDSLQFNPSTFRFDYPVLNQGKRIIKEAAIRQATGTDGLTVLKVYAVKEEREPLNADEMAAFSSYIREIGAAGTHFVFISEAPAPVTVKCIVYYDPQVLDSEGNLLQGEGKPAVQAVEDYTKSIPYTGRFSASRCVDAIQGATGVLDVFLESVKMAGDDNDQPPFFYSASGFFEPAADITYSAQINL